MAEEQEEQEERSKKGNSNLKVIIIAVLAAVLLSGGMVGATIYFLKSDESANAAPGEESEEVAEEVEPPPPPMYHSLDPKFVVSFHDQSSARFMQFEIDVMARDKGVIKKIDEHMSAIRSSLLMLFDSQNYSAMVTKDGKLKLLSDVTEDVNKTIVMMAGEDSENEHVVEAAYFTSFVIQ